jgi:hypothetical protein
MGRGRAGHDEYMHYYFAQAMYILGDDGYAKLFPKSTASERLTWSKYRKAMFRVLKESQDRDGSWSRGGGWSIGAIYSTSVNLVILQLDRGTLPIYQR